MKRQHSLNLTFLLCCLVAPIFAQDCGVGEYKCENSGICIGVDKICDGTVDCPDNEEDEWTCTEEPTKCLGPSKVCDGIKDCDNNEDEEECCKHSKLNFYNPSLMHIYVCFRSSRFLIFFIWHFYHFRCIYMLNKIFFNNQKD